MKTVEWSPAEQEDGELVGGLLLPQVATYRHDMTPASSFADTAIASFERENTAAAIAEDIGTRYGVYSEGYSTSMPADWNPFRTMRETWSEERKKSLDLYVRAGLFDDIATPAQLEIKARNLEEEMRRNEVLAHGGGFGATIGGLAGAIVDPINLLPITAAAERIKTATNLGRIALGAGTGAAAAGASEGTLHAFQDTRTAEESVYNILGGAVLGGALGAVSHLMHPLVEKLGERSRAAPDDLVAVPGWDPERVSLSAAALSREAPVQDKGILSDIPGVNLVAAWIDARTPVGRALQWTSDEARRVIGGILDLGGRFTGGVQRASWEDLKRDYLITNRDTLFLKADAIFARTNRDLGEVGDKRIGQPQFEEIARRKLLGTWTDADTATLRKQLGEAGAVKAEQSAAEYAEEIHKTNARVEEQLLAIGKVRNDQIVTKLRGEIQSLKDQVAEVAAPHDRAIAETDRNLSDIKENRAALGQKDAADRRKEHTSRRAEQVAARNEAVSATRAANAQALAEKEKMLAEEMAKPKAMGREYGHAQLWDRQTILAKKEEFEQFLRSVLVDLPDEEWLASRFELTADQWGRLGKEPVEVNRTNVAAGTTESRLLSPEEGAALKADVLKEWAGDEWTHRLTQAELRAEAAEVALKQAELDLNDLSRAFGFVKREQGRVSLQEARTARNHYYAKLTARKAHTEQLRAERDALRKAFTAGNYNSFARASQEIDRLPDVGGQGFGDAFAAAPKGAALDKAFADPLEAPKAPELAPTIDTAVAAEKLAAADRRLQRADALVRETEARLSHWDETYGRVAEKLDILTKAKEAIKGSLKEARDAGKTTAQDARAARREAASVKRSTPLDEAVEEIRNKLLSQNELPRAIMDRIATETGRAKARRIILAPEQRRVGENLGFLRTDLRAILESQHDQTAGYIAGNQALQDLGFANGLSDWGALLQRVADDYDRLRKQVTDKAAKGEKAPKTVEQLVAEQEKVTKDLGLLKDRLLGTENVGADKGGWAYWLSRKVREANFVRTGIDFGINSFNDIASVYLREGSLGRLLRDHGGRAVREMRRAAEEDPSGFQAMVRATEYGMQGARMARALDTDDVVSHHGIGARGTLKQRVTAAVDIGADWLSRKTNVLSGQHAWNRFWKITAGIARSYKLRDMVSMFDSLTALEQADLGTLGIGRAEAVRIAKMIEKHSSTVDGDWDPNLDAWLGTADGREAARDFRIAIERDMTRAISTPGIGDVPALMSNAVGRLWLQFQTFAFTFMNRVLVPASQRLATYKDAQALVGFAHLMWSSALVLAAKDLMRGEDPSRRFETNEGWARSAYDIVDRSGLTTWMSPYIDSMLKLTAPVQQAAFGGALRSSKFASKEWFGSTLGGPAMGLAEDIQRFGSSVTNGDGRQSLERGLRLAPWNDLTRLALTLDTALMGD